MWIKLNLQLCILHISTHCPLSFSHFYVSVCLCISCFWPLTHPQGAHEEWPPIIHISNLGCWQLNSASGLLLRCHCVLWIVTRTLICAWVCVETSAGVFYQDCHHVCSLCLCRHVCLQILNIKKVLHMSTVCVLYHIRSDRGGSWDRTTWQQPTKS